MLGESTVRSFRRARETDEASHNPWCSKGRLLRASIAVKIYRETNRRRKPAIAAKPRPRTAHVPGSGVEEDPTLNVI